MVQEQGKRGGAELARGPKADGEKAGRPAAFTTSGAPCMHGPAFGLCV